MSVLSSRLLAVLTAATLLAAQPVPKDYHQLEQLAQQFTEALVTNRPREIYRLFVPAFTDEIEFGRFDSALAAWYRGRRLAKARDKVVDVRGITGNVSTWATFEGEPDYEYIYQSWLYTKDGWRIVWLSRIIDQSFQYGRADSAELETIGQLALSRLVEPEVLCHVRPNLVLPDTVVIVRRGLDPEGDIELPGRVVLALTPAQVLDQNLMPDVPYYFRFGLIRVLGDYAVCTIDMKPAHPLRPGPLGRQRSVQMYLERDADGWRFHSVNRIW